MSKAGKYFRMNLPNLHISITFFQHSSGIQRFDVILTDMEIQKVIWSLPYSTDLAGDTWVEGRVEIVAKDIPDYVYRVRIRHF